LKAGTPVPTGDLEQGTVLYGHSYGEKQVSQVSHPGYWAAIARLTTFEMKVSADPDFRNFVVTLAALSQAIGRHALTGGQGGLRSARCRLSLRLSVKLVKASESLEAATKTERTEIAIRAALQNSRLPGEDNRKRGCGNDEDYRPLE